MKRTAICAALLGIFLGLGLSSSARAGDVVVLTYAGPINAISAEYISRGITEAESRHASALILQLDTPGGFDSAMRKIVQAEMNAPVPIIVFVAPRGARAASAGCFIVLAADVAAMAPGTNIGAAHPILLSGGVVSEKILNDAAAYARSIAAARHRNIDWAEKSVRDSVSLPESEALQQGVIDLAANDVADLLSQLNGRVVHMTGGDVTLSVAGATQVNIGMNWSEEILNTLADPTVAYLFLLLGILAIVIELFAPHGFVTGTLGAIAVLLALFGLANLPVHLTGLLLLVLGMSLLGLELKVTSHGVLTAAGLIAFVFGSLFLFPRAAGYAISPWAIGITALLWVVMLAFVVRIVLRTRHAAPLTGVQRVIGSVGVAKTDLAPKGVVLVNGEDWDASADPAPIARGEKISVLEIHGLTLRVRKVA
ncbi:MAG TPA: nodulation protein NfeD [Candidatus Acidoferrales bacterium]|nr:nodulation protein NfeD [Candidatus Acidoferrales bacterium]